MDNFFTSAIATIASFFKPIRFKQALVVVFASFLLLTNTACQKSMAASPGSYDYNAAPSTTKANERPSKDASTYRKGTGPERELYKPTQTPQGGMNNYNDDLRYDQKGANAKANQLVNQAEDRLHNRAANPKEALDNAREYNPFSEGVRDIKDRVGSVAESAKSNIADDAQKGTRNLKENLKQAQQSVPDVLNKTKENASGATRSVREGAEDLSKGVQRAGDRL